MFPDIVKTTGSGQFSRSDGTLGSSEGIRVEILQQHCNINILQGLGGLSKTSTSAFGGSIGMGGTTKSFTGNGKGRVGPSGSSGAKGITHLMNLTDKDNRRFF